MPCLSFLIACFNFLNLSTAGALGRAKETGVQKVLGAKTITACLLNFLRSPFCFVLFAHDRCSSSCRFATAVLQFIGGHRTFLRVLMLQPNVLLALAGLLLIVSLIAGIYPSIFLARFKSTDVFRSILKTGNDKWLRKSLVTTQFALSILLIIATIVVKQQMNYIATKDLGFQKDQVMVVPLTNTGMEAMSKEFTTALKSISRDSIGAIKQPHSRTNIQWLWDPS